MTSLTAKGGQAGEFVIETINHILFAIKKAGLTPPGKEITGFDPESATTFFTEVLNNAETVVTALQSLDPTILAAVAIGSVAAGFVSWLLAGQFKKIGLELKGRGLLATLKNLMFKKKRR